MKEKIGIEKLIELLNEYDKEKGLHTFWKMTQSNKIQIYGKGVCSESYLYSKSYGFIKWLVENDKIDIKALVVKGEMRSGWDFDNKKGDEETGEESWNKYYSELCLMLLAIQENPIDFLCSILK